MKPHHRHVLTSEDCAESQARCVRSLSVFRSTIAPFVPPAVQAMLESVATPESDLPPELEYDSSPTMAPGCVLRAYQLRGLSWMINQYDRRINCILADEMGLGKTLQSISFIAHLLHVRKEPGQHLIIVPLSVVATWMSEFRRWCPQIKVLRFHTNDPHELARLKTLINDSSVAEVVVTTYSALKTAGVGMAFQRPVWRSVILDEGHKIKNDAAQVSAVCGNLRAVFKIILSGTPVQNNLTESWALLKFLVPSVFTSSSVFDDAFDLSSADSAPNKVKVDRKLLDKAHYLMRIFVLRRLKTEVEYSLPPKLETKINCPMTGLQKTFMQKLLLKEATLLDRVQRSTEGQREGEESAVNENIDPKKLLSLVCQLRKASNHPFLFTGVEKPPVDGSATEDIVHVSGKMEVLDRLLNKLIAKGHRVVIFSQWTRMLDILSDYLDMRRYKHLQLSGRTNRVMREVLIDMFNRVGSEYQVFCLSTRAGGEGINLYTADTVILFDSDWNPQVDVQAMARVHRIRQTKVVHIYRLVTAGTVEERIVQRAQRKLYLDSVVNRGSTAKALAVDEMIAKQQQDKAGEVVVENELNEEGDVPDDGLQDISEPTAKTDLDDASRSLESSQILATLKFGWNSVFSVSTPGEDSLTDEDLDTIIDRTRGLEGDSHSHSHGHHSAAAATASPHKRKRSEDEESSDKVARVARLNKILENQERSIEDFNENAPLVSLRQFDGKEIASVSSSSKEYWATLPLADGGKGKRTKSARTFKMAVTGVGMVDVLHDNNYDLEDGEPSVTGREQIKRRQFGLTAEAVAPEPEVGYLPKVGRQIAGRDYEGQDYCQGCWDGGTIFLCDYCPHAWHKKCLLEARAVKSIPSKMWSCPMHSCMTCKRSAAAAGLIFRCDVCPRSYCEDCLPPERVLIGKSQRLESLGYALPSSACYIYCSKICENFGNSVDISKLQEPVLELAEDGTYCQVAVSDKKADEQAILRKLSFAALPDVTARLKRHSQYGPGSRFKKLGELPLFEDRLGKCEVTARQLLLLAIGAVKDSVANTMQSAASVSVYSVKQSAIATMDANSAASCYRGVPVTANMYTYGTAFLACAQLLSKANTRTLGILGDLLGLAVINASPLAVKEPIFSVLNMASFPPVISPTKANPTPFRFSAILVWHRHLESLGQRVAREGRYYALTSKTEAPPRQSSSDWKTTFYTPSSSFEEVESWVEPARRVLKYLMDKRVRPDEVADDECLTLPLATVEKRLTCLVVQREDKAEGFKRRQTM